MSPRSKHQFQVIREEKKALIMDVALEHFAGRGFHATTIYHIARHAGISKGLMYNYFSSKEDLLLAIFRRSAEEIYEDFDTDMDGILSEAEFEKFIKRFTKILHEKRLVWKLFFQMMMLNDIREILVQSGKLSNGSEPGADLFFETEFMPGAMKLLREYFERKKPGKKRSADSLTEMTMFLISMKGLTVNYIFGIPGDDEARYDKIVERIIEQFK
jgi:AcrR family transcriptional regulator